MAPGDIVSSEPPHEDQATNAVTLEPPPPSPPPSPPPGLRVRYAVAADGELRMEFPGGSRRDVVNLLIMIAVGIAAAGIGSRLNPRPPDHSMTFGSGVLVCGMLVAFIGTAMLFKYWPEYLWPTVIRVRPGRMAARGLWLARRRERTWGASQLHQIAARGRHVRLATERDGRWTAWRLEAGDKECVAWTAQALQRAAGGGPGDLPDEYEAVRASAGEGLTYGVGVDEAPPIVREPQPGGGLRLTARPRAVGRPQWMGPCALAGLVMLAAAVATAPGDLAGLLANAGILLTLIGGAAWWANKRLLIVTVTATGVTVERRGAIGKQVTRYAADELKTITVEDQVVMAERSDGRKVCLAMTGDRSAAAAIAGAVREGLGWAPVAAEAIPLETATAVGNGDLVAWKTVPEPPLGVLRFARSRDGWTVTRVPMGWATRAATAAGVVAVWAGWSALIWSAFRRWDAVLTFAVFPLGGVIPIQAWLMRVWATERISFDGETLRIDRPTLLGRQRLAAAWWFVSRLTVKVERQDERGLWLKLSNGRRVRLLAEENEGAVRWLAELIARSARMRGLPGEEPN